MLHHTAYGAFFRSCIIELGFPIEMGVPPESERLCISRVSNDTERCFNHDLIWLSANVDAIREFILS